MFFNFLNLAQISSVRYGLFFPAKIRNPVLWHQHSKPNWKEKQHKDLAVAGWVPVDKKFVSIHVLFRVDALCHSYVAFRRSICQSFDTGCYLLTTLATRASHSFCYFALLYERTFSTMAKWIYNIINLAYLVKCTVSDNLIAGVHFSWSPVSFLFFSQVVWT